jgi:hypothetical protein
MGCDRYERTILKCRAHKEVAVILITHVFVTAANSLWNSLLEPVGHKSRNITEPPPISLFLCPTDEHPYIYTARNSVT